jgi:hypothetical protein
MEANMTAQHTSGPWSHDWQFIVAPDPAGIHPDIYIAEIAETDEEGRVATPEQREANGRLIAAAPRLLKALEIAEQAIEEATDIMHHQDGEPVTALEGWEIERAYLALCSVLVEVDQAIAEARE